MLPARLFPLLVVVTSLWGGVLAGRPWQLVAVGFFALVGLLWLPPEKRVGAQPGWLAAPLLPVLLSLPGAWDHQWAWHLTALWLLALVVFAFGLSYPLSLVQQRVLACVAVSTVPWALAQASGGLSQASEEVGLLPQAWAPQALARLATGRAFGTLALPGHFAALQAMVVPLFLAWHAQVHGWRRFLPAVGLVASLAGTVASRSLLGAGLWLLALFWFLPRHRHPRLPFWLALALATLGGVVWLREDLPRLEPLHLRWVNWQVAWWAFRQWPWLGVGPGGLGMASLTSPWAQQHITPFAHSLPLQLLADLGLAGLPAALMGLGGLAWLIGWLYAGHRSLAVALLVGLVHNLFDFSFFEPGFLFPYVLLVTTGMAQLGVGRSRLVPSWLVVGLALPAMLIASLEARCSGEAWRARVLPENTEKAQGLLKAASWTPWRLSEVLEATEAALEASNSSLQSQVLAQLDRRSWVAPASAAVAHTRALLLLAQGRRGEAWAWVREAQRRAPHRQELALLEARCRP